MIFLYITCFFVSLVMSVLLTPVSIFLSKKFNVYDIPSRRKIHTRPIPRWGGLGVFLSVFGTVFVAYLLFPKFGNLLSEILKQKSKLVGVVSLNTQLMGILAGSVLVLILGMIDDKKGVKPLTKLLVQIIAAYCTMDFGVRIFGIASPFTNKYVDLPLLLSQIVTVFWLIGFMNTINLADGLDGLAAGIVAIASATFFIVAILLKSEVAIRPDKIWLVSQLQLSAVLSIVVCGASLGFLFFNFQPAIVFLGDGGALFLGYLLASISILGTLKMPLVISVFIPVIIVALPILDVLLAILRRFHRGIDITKPDREHIHHRLLKLGWTHREVVLLMYVITLVLSVITVGFIAWKLGVRI